MGVRDVLSLAVPLTALKITSWAADGAQQWSPEFYTRRIKTEKETSSPLGASCFNKGGAGSGMVPRGPDSKAEAHRARPLPQGLN